MICGDLEHLRLRMERFGLSLTDSFNLSMYSLLLVGLCRPKFGVFFDELVSSNYLILSGTRGVSDA